VMGGAVQSHRIGDGQLRRSRSGVLFAVMSRSLIVSCGWLETRWASGVDGSDFFHLLVVVSGREGFSLLLDHA
jgi:hypothetical protein